MYNNPMTEYQGTHLPLFPLELIVFPGQDLQLHIFEPRYRELIGECRETGITFGIPALIEKRLHPYGTEMQLVAVEKVYEDGRMDIKTRGIRCFRLLEFLEEVPGHLYSAGIVSFLANEEDPQPDTARELVDALRALRHLVDPNTEVEAPEGPGLSFSIAHEVGLELSQKIRLVSMERESERQAYLLEHLQRITAVLERANELRRLRGGNGHARKLRGDDA